MDQAIKAQWLKDLRSGEIKQGRGHMNLDDELCCLAVLAEQAVNAGVIEKHYHGDTGLTHYDGKADILTPKLLQWAGLPESDDSHNPGNPSVFVHAETTSLAQLNDGETEFGTYSFNQIADVIEAQF